MKTAYIVLAVCAAWIWVIGCVVLGAGFLWWHFHSLPAGRTLARSEPARAQPSRSVDDSEHVARQREISRKLDRAIAEERQAQRELADRARADREARDLHERQEQAAIQMRREFDRVTRPPDPPALGDDGVRKGGGRFGDPDQRRARDPIARQIDEENARQEKWLNEERVKRERDAWRNGQQPPGGAHPDAGRVAGGAGAGPKPTAEQRRQLDQWKRNLAAANSVRKRGSLLAEGGARAAANDAAFKTQMKAGVQRATP